MKDERGGPVENPDGITHGEYAFLIAWVVCLVFLYAAGGFFAAELLKHYAAESARMRQSKIESPSVDSNAEGAGLGPRPGRSRSTYLWEEALTA